MTDERWPKGLKLDDYYDEAIKFCPECGKDLEINPNSGWKSCFVHGSFSTYVATIIWEPMAHMQLELDIDVKDSSVE